MADPLVVEDVVRYFVNMTLGGRDCSCIVDMNIAPLGDRIIQCQEGGNAVLEYWDAGPLTVQNAELQPQSVSWIDLNSESGSTGTVTAGIGGSPTWPSTGDQSGLSAPSNVAVRVNKNVASIRGLNKGRMYVPGMSEGDTDAPNTLAASRLTGWQTAMNTMWAGLDGYVLPTSTLVVYPCVVHKPESGPPSFSRITSYTVLGSVKSQGRRLR